MQSLHVRLKKRVEAKLGREPVSVAQAHALRPAQAQRYTPKMLKAIDPGKFGRSGTLKLLKIGARALCLIASV